MASMFSLAGIEAPFACVMIMIIISISSITQVRGEPIGNDWSMNT